MKLVGFQPQRYNYEELDKKVDTLATNLIDTGLQKDDVVIVQLPNISELAMAYLAITMAGAIISPVPMQWRSKELSYISKLTEAKMFIGMDNYKNFNSIKMAQELQQNTVHLKHIISLIDLRVMTKGKIDQTKLLDVRPTANEVFTIQWTSGTEADPKGCPLTHNNQIFQARCYKALGLKAGGTILCLPPLVNASGISAFFAPWLLMAGTFVLHHPFDLEVFIKQVAEEKINYFGMVPAMLNMLLKFPNGGQLDLNAVSLIVTGSAPPSPWSMKEFKRRWGMDICNIYGMNEGSVFASIIDLPKEIEKKAGLFAWWGKKGVNWPSEKINKSVGAIESKVIDENGREVTNEGDVGELRMKSPGIFSGYYNRPDITEKAFDEEGFFCTGDLFQIAETNYLSFFDRAKDIIIRGGYNISAQEVENLILKHPDIIDAAAVSMPNNLLGEKLCLYVVIREGKSITLDDVVSFLKESGMAVYKLPERIETISEIPRNPVGKIVKTDLRKDIRAKIVEGSFRG
jgi:acyl-CoA synthetase (AMP-forming)/AMP-acid ligase II